MARVTCFFNGREVTRLNVASLDDLMRKLPDVVRHHIPASRRFLLEEKPYVRFRAGTDSFVHFVTLDYSGTHWAPLRLTSNTTIETTGASTVAPVPVCPVARSIHRSL